MTPDAVSYKVIFHKTINSGWAGVSTHDAFLQFEAVLPFVPTLDIHYELFEGYDGEQPEEIYWDYKNDRFEIHFHTNEELYQQALQTGKIDHKRFKKMVEEYLKMGWMKSK